MNILLLHGSSDLYGASKILLHTVHMLHRRGHKPLVILSEEGPLVAALADAGAEIYFIRLGILRRKYKSLKGILNRCFVLRNAYFTLKRLIKEKNIQLVYSNTTAVLAGAFAAKSLGIKHVWHVHEIIEQPKWLYFILGKLLNNLSDTVIIVSEAVFNSWRKYVSEEKLSLVYNGISYGAYLQPDETNLLRNELGVDHNTVIIGMIGRVHYWKGQIYFLQIAAHLAKKFTNLHFVLAGDAFPGYEYLYDEIKTIITKENIGPLVTNLGYRTTIPTIMRGLDILVLPSILPDPFPTVVLEGMASAKPLAATAHGGALEMVDDGITGVHIPVNQPEAAAKIIGRLIKDPSLRMKMGEAGRQKVLTNYSLEAFERKMIKVLE